MSDKLALAVRQKLRITYSDTDNDARIAEIMAQADRILRFELGIDDDEFSFEDPAAGCGKERLLFINWCFYEYNDAADDFWTNYATEIAQVREWWVTRQYVNEEESDDN